LPGNYSYGVIAQVSTVSLLVVSDTSWKAEEAKEEIGVAAKSIIEGPLFLGIFILLLQVLLNTKRSHIEYV